MSRTTKILALAGISMLGIGLGGQAAFAGERDHDYRNHDYHYSSDRNYDRDHDRHDYKDKDHKYYYGGDFNSDDIREFLQDYARLVLVAKILDIDIDDLKDALFRGYTFERIMSDRGYHRSDIDRRMILMHYYFHNNDGRDGFYRL